LEKPIDFNTVHIYIAMVNMRMLHWYCLWDCRESRPAAATNQRTVCTRCICNWVKALTC